MTVQDGQTVRERQVVADRQLLTASLPEHSGSPAATIPGALPLVVETPRRQSPSAFAFPLTQTGPSRRLHGYSKISAISWGTRMENGRKRRIDELARQPRDILSCSNVGSGSPCLTRSTPYPGLVRLAVCVSEGDYRTWWDARIRVLTDVASILGSRDQVVVRSGSLINKETLRDVWLEGDERQERRLATESGVPFTVYLLSGLPRATVPEIRDLLRLDDDVICTTVISPDEVDLLFGLEFTLPLRFRLTNGNMFLLHTALDSDDSDEVDPHLVEDLRSRTELSIHTESMALRETAFDVYLSPQHFKLHVEIAQFASDPWRAEAVASWLDWVDPRLKETLHAAMERASSAETNEQAAQAGFSCRRYLIQLADALFPAQDEEHNDRSVTADKYLNRLWAALKIRAGPGLQSTELERIGSTLDLVKDNAVEAVHHFPAIDQHEALRLAEDLLNLSDDLRSLADVDRAQMETYTPEFERIMNSDLHPDRAME